jgi:glycosyltransferase involved in cell wall biosynthesis
LADKKGFADLIRAVGLLHDRKVPITCEIVGDGEEEKALKQLATRLGISEKVQFHGWLPFDQVKEKMRKATLLVHPSSELGDGLPNVVKEAMASGTPVIASDIAGIPEGLDFGRCGILTPPKNPQALADQMERLLARTELRRDLSHRARIFAEAKFDLWKNGKRLADLLRSTRRGQPSHDAIPARPFEDDSLSKNAFAEEPELLVKRSAQNVTL